jgi:diguanylate cyclase
MNTQTTDNVQRTQKRLLLTFKHQFRQLSQFLGRVAAFYQGISPELDRELRRLREHFEDKFDFDLADESMAKLTGFLMENSELLKQQNCKAIGLLEHTLENLQIHEDIPQDLKIDTANLLKLLPKRNTSLYASLPFFEKTLKLYKRAISSSEGKSGSNIPTSEADFSVGHNLHHEIIVELRELLEQISTTKINQQTLVEIKAKLTKGINNQQLLECCLGVIRTFMTDLLKERKYARKFIFGLHDSLTKVNGQATRSVEISESQHSAKTQNNAELREHIIDIGNTVTTETDLVLLKKQTHECLINMSRTIDEAEQSSKAEQLVMMQLLSEMKAQLVSLEEEAAGYKDRLVEQKKHNYKDTLTSLPNRQAYNERIEVEYARWKRHGTGLCLAVLDVDHFKRVNDNYGHAAGDKTLRVIALNIGRCLRSTDFLARWGGEEFVILFPQSDIADIEKPLELINQRIREIPFKFKDQRVTITISIGATSFVNADIIESVFERADKNLFQAKNTGRNRCIIN